MNYIIGMIAKGGGGGGGESQGAVQSRGEWGGVEGGSMRNKLLGLNNDNETYTA